jgi:hypothetical protein
MRMAETVTIGGEDFTDTDVEARAIMAHQADQGITETVWARMPYREAVNRVLRARLELQEARPMSMAGRREGGAA